MWDPSVLMRGGRSTSRRATRTHRHRDRRYVGLSCSLAMAAWLVGCSEGEDRVPVYPVEGKVSVAGEVPEGALIVLYPAKGGEEKELRPSAKVRQDGSF